MERYIILILLAVLTFASSTHTHGQQPANGYRGFIDGHFDVGSESGFWGNHEAYFYYGVSTTHGRQFNPHLFVGGGMDLEYNPSFGRTIFALYAAGRTDWQFGRYTPYGDVRLGLSTSGGGGVYFSPTVGYRFNWGRKASINVGLGLTLKSKNMESYDFTILPDGSGLLTPLGRKHLAECLFAILLGVEFGK